MSEIEVRELKRDEYKIWDELVEKSPHGTIFHRCDWLTTCSELLNKKLKIYGCFEKDQLIGGCSLYVYKSRFFKTASSTIEMTPYGGVVLAESPSSKVRKQEQTYRDIIKSLCNAFDNEAFDYIQITNSPDFVDVRPFTWNGWDSKVRYAYYVNLEGNIKKNISENARRTIKNAIKNDMKIERLNNNDVVNYFPQYYDLFKMNYLRQNLRLPVLKEFFEIIINSFESKDIGGVWVAKTSSGEVVAVHIGVWDNKRAYGWAAASHTSFRQTGVTSLLLYTGFQDLKNKGFKEINLMSGNTPRFAKFALSFNPRLVPYYAIEKSRIKYKIIANTYKIVRHPKSRLDKSNEV